MKKRSKKPPAYKRTPLTKPKRTSAAYPFGHMKQTTAAPKHPYIGEIRPSLLGGPISSRRRY
jgi:hypothetical protein